MSKLLFSLKGIPRNQKCWPSFALILTLIFSINTLSAQYCASSQVTGNTSKRSVTSSLTAKINGEDAIVINLVFNIMNSGSTSTVTEAQCLTTLSILNDRFKNSDIAFRFNGYRNYYNNAASTINSVTEFDGLDNINTTTTSLRVYLVDGFAGSFNTGTVGRAELPGTFMAIRKDSRDTFVLAHEIGHNLNLFHTFHGASCEPDPNIPAELANGNNCASAGDLVCDTPADPCMNQSTVDNACNYTGGGAFNPDTSNYMSYTELFCGTNFTDGQTTRMRDALVLLNNLQSIQTAALNLARPTVRTIRNNYTRTPIGGGCFEIQYFETTTLTFQRGYQYTISKTVPTLGGSSTTNYTFNTNQTPVISEGFSDFTYTATITDMTGVSYSGSGSAGWTQYIDCPIWFPLMSNRTTPIQSGEDVVIEPGLYAVPIHDEDKKVIEKAKIMIKE